MAFREHKDDAQCLEKVIMKCDKKLGVDPPLPEAGFFWIISGPPGSGKTNLLVNLLTGGNGKKLRNRFYCRKFDKVYLWNKDRHTMPEIPLPDDQFKTILNVDECATMHAEMAKKDQHVLWVFDDMVADIAEPKCLLPFMNIVFNRRHASKTGEGSLSIIIVTQAYNVIPLRLRKACNALSLFTTKNKKEIDSVYVELISWMSAKLFKQLLRYVFREPHDFLFVRTDLPAGDCLYHNFNRLEIKDEDDDGDYEITD